MNSVDEVWKSVLALLEQTMTRTSVSTWFEDLEPVTLTEDRFVLCAPVDFKRDVINSRYLKTLEDAVYELFAERLQVEVISPAQRDAGLSSVLSTTLHPSVVSGYTFERFIVGNSNQFAYNAAQAVAKTPGNAYNPLFVYGEPGLGKTHLLYAIYNRVRRNYPGYRLVAVTGEEFTNEVTHAIGHKTTEALRAKYREMDMLLVDDIQFIAGKEATQVEFFNTFNHLYEAGRQIVLISDRPPSDMVRLEERLRSRFEWGLQVDIQAPEYETRLAIVREKADQMGLSLPPAVMETIAKNITGNVRQIEGVVRKMLAMKEMNGAKMDTDTLMQALQELLRDKDSFIPTPEAIVEVTAKFYDVSVEDILSSSRIKEITQARQVAMYVVRQMTKLSLPDIGHFFKRDHTTVIYSLEKVEGLVREDRETAEIIRDIKSNLNARAEPAEQFSTKSTE